MAHPVGDHVTFLESWTRAKRSWWFDLTIMLVCFAIITAVLHSCQPRTTKNDGKGWDGGFYYGMAEQARAGKLINAQRPFVYRLGTVKLVGAIGEPNLLDGFYHVNIIANALTVILMTLWLRRSGAPLWAIFAANLFFQLHWIGPLRFARFYPATIDPWVFPFLIAGLLLMTGNTRRSWAGRMAFWLLVPVGIFFREMVLILPLVALVPRTLQRPTWRDIRDELLFAVPALVFGVLAWLLVKKSVIAFGPYEFAPIAKIWWKRKGLNAIAIGWLNVYGPLLLLLVLTWRSYFPWLGRNLHLVAYLAGIFILSWVGGSDIERFALWAAPVLLCIAATGVATWKDRWTLMFAVGVLALLTTRALYPVPQDTVQGCHGIGESLFAPVGACIPYLDLYYWHGSKISKVHQGQWHLFASALLLTLFVLSLLERRAARRRASRSY